MTAEQMRKLSVAKSFDMNADTITRTFVDSIQPIVLVGGKSRRFGRDKLREPWNIADPCDSSRSNDSQSTRPVLVQRPIEALRSVFGPRVKLVGNCDSAILLLADGVITDVHPGIGPMGGIISALHASGGPIFVLAGDMPAFTHEHVWLILQAARTNPHAVAVLAATDLIHPCAGLYLPRALDVLVERAAHGEFKLQTAIEADRMMMVQIAAEALVNINTTADLSAEE